jgi:hypothetical protein
MSDVCVGGLYDGMPINGIEDRVSCQENEGQVQSRGGGGCSASNIAPMMFTSNIAELNKSAISALLLLPLRLVRDSLANSPIVASLEELNDSLFPEIERIIADNDKIKETFVNTLIGISYFAGSMLESAGNKNSKSKSVFTKSLHNQIVQLAEEIKPCLCDDRHNLALNMAVISLGVLVGKNAAEVYAILHNMTVSTQTTKNELSINFRDVLEPIETVNRLTSRFPGGLDSIVSAVNDIHKFKVKPSVIDEINNEISPTVIFEFLNAERKIENKAGLLGSLAGAPISNIESLGSGNYLQHYQGVDIYFSNKTNAHEVQGDIRAKYNAIGGANSVLGMPLTDEQGTPDGIGRFNHFENGSIYWTPNTGPMMLHTALRNLWASQGWERGFFGYPVADQHRKVFTNPAAQPAQYWEFFQNGAIFASKFEAAPALIAELSPPKLATLVRQMFDSAFHEADSNLGIEGGVNLLRVSDWSYGFWASVPRNATYEIQGFYKHPLSQFPIIGGILPDVEPDTTFRLELTLEFGLSWPNSFTEPAWKTLTVSLLRLYVHTSGIGNGSLHDKLDSAIWNKFKEPLAIKDIPVYDAKFIGILLTQTGALQFLLEPDLGNSGYTLNRYFFQQELDKLVPD